MSRLANIHRRIESALAPVASVMETCSRPVIARALALLVGLAWLVLVGLVKVRLLTTCILTSDIAYYENMLYNTGFSVSRRSFDFLFTWYDVLNHSRPTYLMEHFSPTLAVLAPAYWLLPHPLLLTLVQPVLGALAGWGLFRLTRRLLQRQGLPPMLGLLPVFFQAAYLFNYSNISAYTDTVYGFHQDSMSPALLVWTLVCVVESRWRTALVLFALFLGVKENLPIITAPGLAVCLVFNRLMPRKRAAIGLLLCAVFFAGCYYFEFRTHNRHVGIIHRFLDYNEIEDALLRTDKWMVVQRLWPGLLTPWFALPALADWCLQLVGDTIELDWHSYPLMMYAQLAFAGTCIRLFSLTQRWRLLSLAGFVALGGLVTGPMIAGGCRAYAAIHRGTFSLTPLADVAAVNRLAASVPRDAKLGATSDLLVFLAERRKLFWPESASYAEYVLINRRPDWENKARSDDFLRTSPADNPAGEHFYNDLNLVLRGYEYDANLVTYLDQLVRLGAATLVKSEGKLELYRIPKPVPLPSK